MNNDFAPIIIPTLNRWKHLKRCVESLAQCKQATQTELIIGLDYPPSEKYVEGYNEMRSYLPTIKGFGKVTVLESDHNLGAVKNIVKLRKYVKERGFDRFVFTEDDNEFSPNFLEYVNKGLDLYKDNDKIMAVCGYSYIDIGNDGTANNVIAYRKFSAWGVGQWCNKRFAHEEYGGKAYREQILRSWKTSLKLWLIHPISVNDFLSMHFRNQEYDDSMANAQLSLENKFCVFPKLSMVRNCGHDGSGEHCGTSSVFTNQEIDTSNTFDYDELVLSKDFPNDTYFKNKLISSIIVPFVSLIRYIGYKLFDIDLFGFYFKK